MEPPTAWWQNANRRRRHRVGERRRQPVANETSARSGRRIRPPREAREEGKRSRSRPIALTVAARANRRSRKTTLSRFASTISQPTPAPPGWSISPISIYGGWINSSHHERSLPTINVGPSAVTLPTKEVSGCAVRGRRRRDLWNGRGRPGWRWMAGCGGGPVGRA
jgi:hypothetical protein